jgi:thymidylate kinase
MRYQLIMIAGSCPDSGKSTMTAFLAEQLTAQGVPTRGLLEDTVTYLDAPAPLRESFRSEHPDILNALLAVSKVLVEEFARLPDAHVVDAWLPGYHFLFGLYAASRIATYNAGLYSILSPLHPMLVYLKSDVKDAFVRTQERGREWFDEFLERMNRHYKAARHVRTPLPLRDAQDVVTFFKEMDELAQSMVSEWPGEHLVIDARGQTLDQVKMMLTCSCVRQIQPRWMEDG